MMHGGTTQAAAGAAGTHGALESVVGSPLGRLVIRWRGTSVQALEFEDVHAARSAPARRGAGARLPRVPAPGFIEDAIADYFRGRTAALDGLAAEPEGTPFQRRVWQALRRIPPGATLSYRALAESLGSPNGARAVGRAAATNPVAVIVPCHRVIGTNGALTGFLGGVRRKRWLLEHEAAHAGRETHAAKGGGARRNG